MEGTCSHIDATFLATRGDNGTFRAFVDGKEVLITARAWVSLNTSDPGYSVTAEPIQGPKSPAVAMAPLASGEDQKIVDRIQWPVASI